MKIHIFIFISIFSLAGPTLANSNDRSLDAALQSVHSPNELERLMKQKLKFVDDQTEEDDWQSPAELWNNKQGDCEDFALFSKHALEKMGYKADVVSIYGPDFAHTVTIFIEKGRYNVIDVDKLYRYKSNSIEDALTWINPVWTWASIAKKRGRRGWSTETIKNPYQTETKNSSSFLL